MKQRATSLTASAETYCSLILICCACLSNPSVPPAIPQGKKVARCQRTVVARDSKKRSDRSCSFFNLNSFLLFPIRYISTVSSTVLSTWNITDTCLLNWTTESVQSQKSIPKPHKNKENETSEHYRYQSVKHFIFFIDTYFFSSGKWLSSFGW